MLPIVPACVPGLKMARAGSQLAPPFVVRENHDCSTYDCALILPWSLALIPGGERKRSQTA
jgi:hypothetical protein